MNRYEWEGYHTGEEQPFCDGIVYAYTEKEAREKVEKESRENQKPLPDVICILEGDFVGCEAKRWLAGGRQ